MERALKSFLDGISDDDNVVNLEEAVKNDNEDDEEEEASSGVIAQGNASGMLDMRAMAQRYQEMSSSSFDTPEALGESEVRSSTEARSSSEAKSFSEVPLPGQILRKDILAPIVEAEDAPEGRGLLIATVALAVLVTIVSTAAVTAVWVKRSVMAEVRGMQMAAPASVTQTPAAVATTPEAGSGGVDVADWPPSGTAVAAGTGVEEDGHLEMNFDESEVDAMRRRRERDDRKSGTAALPIDPVAPVVPATPAEVEVVPATTTTTTTTTTPIPTSDPISEGPKPKVAADGEPCDEVTCLVDGRGCCGKVKSNLPVEPEIDTSLPERLARNDVNVGLAKVEGRLNSCGVRFEVSGVVKLKLKISPEGKVTKSSANKGDADFQRCISAMLKKARFAKTQQGASLTYPKIFR